MEISEVKIIEIDLVEAFDEEIEFEAFKNALLEAGVNIRRSLLYLFNKDHEPPTEGKVQCLSIDEIEMGVEDLDDNSLMRILAFDDPGAAIYSSYYLKQLHKTTYKIEDPRALQLIAKIDI